MTTTTYYSIPQLAAYFGKSEKTIYRWLDTGVLGGAKVGTGWYVTAEDVAAAFVRNTPRPVRREPVRREPLVLSDVPVPAVATKVRERRQRLPQAPVRPARQSQYSRMVAAMAS